MNTPPSYLGVSHALGFWSKHTYAMDELYELYGQDDSDFAQEHNSSSPLMALWNSNRRNDLIKVFEHAEADRDLVYREVYRLLETTLGSKDSPLKLERRRWRDPWIIGAYATPLRKKLPQGRIWLTSQFNTASDDDWCLYTTLWAKGGRKTSRIICEQLSGVVEASKAEGNEWDSGAVFLSRIRLSKHRIGDDLAINLDSLVAELRSHLMHQTATHLNNMIDKLKAA